ncbi:MAG TPA: DUF1905 domain-containing protein [Anaerolineales bacterium]|nr:DUF1905 domain-containing protein [Anaerolineales bacterium]HNN13462.1 DUF1905 domain-containing protein [Anaerolineales bacterium]
MVIRFIGKIFQWRGPAPYLFVAVPDKDSQDIKSVSQILTYGWGVIPVTVTAGRTEWKTSLFPKDGRYLVPIKMAVQRAENLKEGDKVRLQLELNL